jgi:hypothetical protein
LNAPAQARPFLFQEFAAFLHHDHPARADLQDKPDAPALFRHTQLGQRIQCLGYCQGIDGELTGQLPDGGEIGPFLIGAIQNAGQHLVDDLSIYRKVVGPHHRRDIFLMTHRSLSKPRLPDGFDAKLLR